MIYLSDMVGALRSMSADLVHQSHACYMAYISNLEQVITLQFSKGWNHLNGGKNYKCNPSMLIHTCHACFNVVTHASLMCICLHDVENFRNHLTYAIYPGQGICTQRKLSCELCPLSWLSCHLWPLIYYFSFLHSQRVSVTPPCLTNLHRQSFSGTVVCCWLLQLSPSGKNTIAKWN